MKNCYFSIRIKPFVCLSSLLYVLCFNSPLYADDGYEIQQLTETEPCILNLYPAVSGNRVVFYRFDECRGFNRGNLMVKLLDTGEEYLLFAQDFTWDHNVVDLEISGDHVVWVDSRTQVFYQPNNPSAEPLVTNDIYLFNLTTGEERRLTEDYENLYSNPDGELNGIPASISPDIQGNWVVWKDSTHRFGCYDRIFSGINLYNIEKGEKIRIVEDEQNPPTNECRIFSDGYCVGQVRTYNYAPVVDNNKVYWIQKVETVVSGVLPDDFDVYYVLKMFDISLGTTTDIRKWTKDEIRQMYDPNNTINDEDLYVDDQNTELGRPDALKTMDVSGNKVIFQIASDLHSHTDIYLYDMKTGKEKLIRDENLSGRCAFLRDIYRRCKPMKFVILDGNFVVWHGSELSPSATDNILLYDIANDKTTQITSGNIFQFLPKMSEGKIVWIGAGTKGSTFLYADWEIFLTEVQIPEPSFRRGDVNIDEKVNIADAIFILSYYLKNQPSPDCLDSADTNDDGQINSEDAKVLLSYLFAQGASLPAPFQSCGVDPTGDNLMCRISNCQ